MQKPFPNWWRTALGEYPTGVTLITSSNEAGEPVGMVVGTFSAVSENPPMVGFMPSVSSKAFKTIAANGRFVGSVLGSAHEELCRDFLARPERRFTTGQWDVTTSGLSRLADSLAWFEATIRDVHPAGDHYVVLADVSAYGVGDGRGGLPLLFLKGGYGAFAVPNSGDNLLDFRDRIRRAEKMSGVVELLARTHGVRCVVATVAGDCVINLVSSPDRPDRERMSFPFAAPLAPVLAAWAGPQRLKAWIENSRHLLGTVDRPRLSAMLDRIRIRGFDVSTGSVMANRFDDVVVDPTTDRSALSWLWGEIYDERVQLDQDRNWYASVSALHVPVFGLDGTAIMELVVNGFGVGITRERFDEILGAARETATQLGVLDPTDRQMGSEAADLRSDGRTGAEKAVAT